MLQKGIKSDIRFFEKGIKSFIGSFGDIVGSNSIIYNGSLENESREIKLINYKHLPPIM